MKDYIDKVKLTELKDYTPPSRALDVGIVRLLHGAMGVSTESGELLDALKKHIYYGKPLDVVNLKEEVGDCLYYLAMICDTLGITIEDAMRLNVAKLAKRYPEGFTQQDATNRDIPLELEVFND